MAINAPRDSLFSILARRQREGANPLEQAWTLAKYASPALMLARLDEELSKIATGGVLSGAGSFGETPAGQLVGEKMPVLALLGHLGLGPAAEQAAEGYADAPGSPVERARAANEAGARGQEFGVGLVNAALSPSNFLGPLARGAEAAKLARVGELIRAVDAAQAAPFEALPAMAKGAGRLGTAVNAAAKARLLATFADDLGRAGGVAGGMPVRTLPTVGGARGYGPQAVPGEAPAFQLGIPESLLGAQGQLPLDLAGGARGIAPPDLPPAVPPVQGIGDLAAAGARLGRPDPREQLVAAAARLAGRDVPPRPPGRALLPDLPPVPTPEVGPQRATYGPETIYPGEGVAPELLERIGRLREFPNPERLDIDAEIGATRDVVTLLQEAYGAQWRNRLAALTGGEWGKPGSGARMVNGRVMLGDLDITAALRDYLETRGGPQGSEFKGALKGLLPGAQEAVPAVPEVSAIAEEAAPAFTGTLDDVRALILGESRRVGTRYPPLDPQFYASRAGVDPAAVPAMLDELVREGTLGRLPGGELALRPGAKAVDDPAAGGGFGAASPLLRRAAGQALAGPHPLLKASVAAGRAEQGAANAASGRGSLVSVFKNLPSIWRTQVTQHPRNLIGDEAWGRLVLRGGQGATAYLKPLRDDMATRMGAATPWEREPQQIKDLMRVLGRDGKAPELGQTMHEAERALSKVIPTSDTAIGEGLLSFLNPAGFAQNLAGPLVGVAKGAARPFLRGFFQAFNGFQQATFRRAALVDEAGAILGEAATPFLDDLAATGADVSRLSPDGLFSADEVAAVAGKVAAQRWQAYADAAHDAATARVKFLFGDFSTQRGAERLVGGAIPFTSWLVRAYPVALYMLAQNPTVALGAYHYMRATSSGAGEDGRPGYTAGMIPADQDTPVLGALVRLYTQGEGGTGYIDPLGAISPVGGELFAPAEDDTGKNWYQKATAWLNRAGLPGPNPLIQAGAYVAGLDYKAPGALSRTQGLENALGLIPGVPAAPDLGGAILRGARGIISPAAAKAGIPGAEADETPSAYDPITRRYAELVKTETGMTLENPANRAYLVGLTDPDNDLLARARREVLLGGAVKNVGSLTSPVGVVGQSGENVAYRAALGDAPFSPAMIAAANARRSRGVAELMARENAGYRARTPAARTYAIGNREQAAWAIVDQFEQSARGQWMKRNAPRSYAAIRRSLMEEVGLREPPKPTVLR